MMAPVPDYAAFIRANTSIQVTPFVPELRLWTADESLPLWTKAQAWIAAGELSIPFWAFPWSGGQALARYVLDHPEVVSGRDVLDFGSGSGLVGLACKLAGARRVHACDIDPFAKAATMMNADLNGLEVLAFDGVFPAQMPEGVSVVVAGDMFYERDASASFSAMFKDVHRSGVEVIVGDPKRLGYSMEGLEEVATYDVPTSVELEDALVRRVAVCKILTTDDA
ncbi:MAG: 50S ribosomal protein L11 methyltransferase [bacterium]